MTATPPPKKCATLLSDMIIFSRLNAPSFAVDALDGTVSPG
jgi:hypothetical protein